MLHFRKKKDKSKGNPLWVAFVYLETYRQLCTPAEKPPAKTSYSMLSSQNSASHPSFTIQNFIIFFCGSPKKTVSLHRKPKKKTPTSIYQLIHILQLHFILRLRQ